MPSVADDLEDDDDDLDDENLDELDDDDDPDDNDPDDWECLTPDGTVEILARAAAEGEAFMRNGLIRMPEKMQCRQCKCTDDRACAGGCFWVAPNLCSRCTA